MKHFKQDMQDGIEKKSPMILQYDGKQREMKSA